MDDALERVRPLLRTRQNREFTDAPLTDDELHALTEVARWSGSSTNSQPWRFIVIRDHEALRRLAEAGMPQTRSLRTATAAIAIVLPNDPDDISYAYDEGRVAERLLIAAAMLGRGAGIAWVRHDVRDAFHEILGLPADRFVRTVVSLGRPSEAGLRPKTAKGEARLPAEEVISQERWPIG